MIPTVSKSGNTVLGPNLKLMIEMSLVESVFLEEDDRVALRIRLEIEKPAPGSYNPAAYLQVVSRHGRNFHNILPRYVVNGEADVIDIGIMPGNLAHSRPDLEEYEGSANVNIHYDDEAAGAP